MAGGQWEIFGREILCCIVLFRVNNNSWSCKVIWRNQSYYVLSFMVLGYRVKTRFSSFEIWKWTSLKYINLIWYELLKNSQSNSRVTCDFVSNCTSEAWIDVYQKTWLVILFVVLPQRLGVIWSKTWLCFCLFNIQTFQDWM